MRVYENEANEWKMWRGRGREAERGGGGSIATRSRRSQRHSESNARRRAAVVAASASAGADVPRRSIRLERAGRAHSNVNLQTRRDETHTLAAREGIRVRVRMRMRRGTIPRGDTRPLGIAHMYSHRTSRVRRRRRAVARTSASFVVRDSHSDSSSDDAVDAHNSQLQRDSHTRTPVQTRKESM